jgi:hypothetical protein
MGSSSHRTLKKRRSLRRSTFQTKMKKMTAIAPHPKSALSPSLTRVRARVSPSFTKTRSRMTILTTRRTPRISRIALMGRSSSR